jgi:hypothetical protein
MSKVQMLDASGNTSGTGGVQFRNNMTEYTLLSPHLLTSRAKLFHSI